MRRLYGLVLTACLAISAGCAEKPMLALTESAAVTQLKTDLESAVEAKRIPGATVVIVRDDEVLADITVGWADIAGQKPLKRDAIFRYYSMSKPITSVAIMMLAEQGKLRLDDPVETYLPELKGVRVYASGSVDDMVTVPTNRPMTIADLLTHQSGITYHFAGTTPVHQYYRKYGVMRDTPVGRMPGDGAPAHSLDELVARIGKAPLLHQPGEVFAYSYSTTVLGAVIERVSGERLDRYLERTLFKPLGMKDTGFFITDDKLPRFTVLYGPNMVTVEQPETSDYRDQNRLLDGGGALAGTAYDYLRFAQMLANGGELNGTRYLSEASIDTLFAPRADMPGADGHTMKLSYGFSVGDAHSNATGAQPDGTLSWSGSGNTYFFVDRRHKAVALLMTHVMGNPVKVRESVNRAAVTLIGD